jgi:NADH-ubiquinone oxidoreductase chain 4
MPYRFADSLRAGSGRSILIGDIMTLSYLGVCRSFALIVAYGLCSSGLFCLCNISYERFGIKSLLVNKGLINLMPRMAML